MSTDNSGTPIAVSASPATAIASTSAAGPAAVALAILDRLDLPARARAERVRLCAVLDGLSAAAPELKVTVDPVENRNFEYQTGISFTFFAATPRPVGELGRGGRYQAGDPAEPEAATGFTLYTDTILRTLPRAAPPRRLLLPCGADRTLGCELRKSGWITVAALDAAVDWRAEARRLGCGYVLEQGVPVVAG